MIFKGFKDPWEPCNEPIYIFTCGCGNCFYIVVYFNYVISWKVLRYLRTVFSIIFHVFGMHDWICIRFKKVVFNLYFSFIELWFKISLLLFIMSMRKKMPFFSSILLYRRWFLLVLIKLFCHNGWVRIPCIYIYIYIFFLVFHEEFVNILINVDVIFFVRKWWLVWKY